MLLLVRCVRRLVKLFLFRLRSRCCLVFAVLCRLSVVSVHRGGSDEYCCRLFRCPSLTRCRTVERLG